MSEKNYTHCGCFTKALLKLTLDSLRQKLNEVQGRINDCSTWGLSEDTAQAVIAELGAMKIEIKMQMHELIDQL